MRVIGGAAMRPPTRASATCSRSSPDTYCAKLKLVPVTPAAASAPGSATYFVVTGGAARPDERGKRGEAVRVADQIDEDVNAVRMCLAQCARERDLGVVDGFRRAVTTHPPPARHERWSAGARAWWLGDQHASGDAGFFLESVRPSTARFETLFSNDRLEGVAHLAGTLSGEVAEHAYWGGARDRLPLAQTDPLAPGDPPAVTGDGRRRVVGGQDNLCLIRSGQDWSDTDGGERRMYLNDVEPVLRAGMDFLRGCNLLR